jgi:hypothetical protein
MALRPYADFTGDPDTAVGLLFVGACAFEPETEIMLIASRGRRRTGRKTRFSCRRGWKKYELLFRISGATEAEAIERANRQLAKMPTAAAGDAASKEGT